MPVQNPEENARGGVRDSEPLAEQSTKWAGFNRDELKEIYHTCELIKLWGEIVLATLGHDIPITKEK